MVALLMPLVYKKSDIIEDLFFSIILFELDVSKLIISSLLAMIDNSVAIYKKHNVTLDTKPIHSLPGHSLRLYLEMLQSAKSCEINN